MLDSRLKYAVAVARLGSFSGAAKDVGVTQSAVTKSVADLEQQLGFAIFSRTSRGVATTPEGRDFIDRAARLLADAADLFGERNRGADPFAGQLRIGLFPGSIDWLINDPAIGLLKRHTAVRIDTVSGNSERAVQLLSRGDIDVAFGLEAALAGWPQFKGSSDPRGNIRRQANVHAFRLRCAVLIRALHANHPEDVRAGRSAPGVPGAYDGLFSPGPQDRGLDGCRGSCGQGVYPDRLVS